MSIAQEIYASKLFKASKRKDIIAQGLIDPRNLGLVTQLAEDLDEEYEDLAQPVVEPEADSAAKDVDEDVEDELPASLDAGLDDDFSPKDNLVHTDALPAQPSESSSKTSTSDESAPSKDDTSDLPPKPDFTPDSNESENSDTQDQIAESTRIDACSRIDTAVIKGSLNNQADTAGVNRVLTKDSELWIYYNDDINLNNVMTQVIEYLNASGETYLEFNRLARSDNAMVFVINQEAQPVKPIESVQASSKSSRVQPISPTGDAHLNAVGPGPYRSTTVDDNTIVNKIKQYYKKTEDEDAKKKVRDVLRKGQGIEITFTDDSTLELTKEDIDSGKYIELIEREMFSDFPYTADSGKSFKDIFDPMLKK